MISKYFSSKLSEKYVEMIKETIKKEIEEIENRENSTSKGIEEQIQELIIQYETSKILLAQQETEKEKQSLVYENHFLVIKQNYLNDGYKPTEAKEHANIELQNEKMVLIMLDEEIALLKANIHSIEYELRLKFKQLELEHTLSYDALKPLKDNPM